MIMVKMIDSIKIEREMLLFVAGAGEHYDSRKELNEDMCIRFKSFSQCKVLMQKLWKKGYFGKNILHGFRLTRKGFSRLSEINNKS